MLKLQFKDQRRSPIWVVDKTFSIGSADDNQLVIDDASVSLQHARIARGDHGYGIRDLGSHGGVYVNQQRVNKKSLQGGDTISIGQVELLVIDPLTQQSSTDTWSLIGCSSHLSGQEFPVPLAARTRAITVGRGSHCDMIFPGAHLSREHVELRIDGDQLRVKDLDSANGTFISDISSSEGVLNSGDKLRLDVYSFIVFGPSKRTPVGNTISSTQKIIPANVVSRGTAPAGSGSARHWKTRPTSPGNRSDLGKSKRQNAGILVVAVVLCAAVIGLGLYLALG